MWRILAVFAIWSGTAASAVQAGCVAAQSNGPGILADAQTGTPIMLVPVVVRDKGGSAVTDLTLANFEIQDKGKPQVISSFAVQRRGEKGPDGQMAQRFTAYLIDDKYVSDAGDFKDMIDALKRHLSNIAPDERISIYTVSCAAALADWTNDPARIQQLLQGLTPKSSGPGLCRVSFHEVLHLSLIKAMIRLAGLSPRECGNWATGGSNRSREPGSCRHQRCVRDAHHKRPLGILRCRVE